MSIDTKDERWRSFAGFVLTFFPVIAAVIAFALQEIWPTWLEERASVIWSGVLVVFLAEFWRSDVSRRRNERLLAKVSAMVIPDITRHSFADAFAVAFEERAFPTRLRVFGLSSYRIQPEIEKHSRSHVIDSIQLLLVNPSLYVEGPTSDFAHESRLAISWGWLGMVRDRSVRKIDLHQYDFYPTEWFVLLDEEVAVFGNYLFDDESIAKAATDASVLVARNHGAGASVVSALSRKFDRLFAATSDGFGEAEMCGCLTWEMDLRQGHWPQDSTSHPSD